MKISAKAKRYFVKQNRFCYMNFSWMQKNKIH